MRWRSMLMFYRRGMLSAATVLLLAPPVILLISSRFDLILWHGAPGGPPKGRDLALLIGGVFGSPAFAAWAFWPSTTHRRKRASLPFLLTRPVRREWLFAFPVVVNAAIMLTAPIIGWAALILWLRLVNPPALDYLRRMLQALSGTPISFDFSWISLFMAAHLDRWLLAGSLLGICATAGAILNRWLSLAPLGRGWWWGNVFGIFLFYALGNPLAWTFLPHFLFFLGPKGSEFHTPPSTVNLLAHLAFIVAVMLPGFRFVKQLEL